MRILVTGAAGSIGRVVDDGLRDAGHDVVGLDLAGPPEGRSGAWEVTDCLDRPAVGDVVGRHAPDGVVHLAGQPGDGTLESSLASHVMSTAALLDAMVEHGVTRIVYASSNHAVGCVPRDDHGPAAPLGLGGRGRPDMHYGVAKVAAEGLLSLFADRAGLDAVACRIGSFRPRPTTRRELATWLSHADSVRMVEAALTAPAPGFAVLWGISANTRGWWDLGPGRALGYEPQDDAEHHRDDVPEGPDDAEQNAIVGGGYALGPLRPAIDPAR